MPKNQDDNTINKHIRKQILDARINANESQEDLAKKLKKSRVAISDMERGKTAINASILVTIADHYDKSITDFYPDNAIKTLSGIEKELIELFEDLPILQKYELIEHIKQLKNSKKIKQKSS